MCVEPAKKNISIYVIQVQTQGEEKFMSLAARALSASGLCESEKDKLYWPRRKLERRKKGRKITTIDPLYPGYVFYRSDVLETEVYRLLKKVPGFGRFLRDNHNIEPLSPVDEEIVLHFISFGDIADKSRVYFDKNDMIQILEGPMKGLEGRIIKVDKRKRRAKVVLNLYKESFPIDLGFEMMNPAEIQNEKE